MEHTDPLASTGGQDQMEPAPLKSNRRQALVITSFGTSVPEARISITAVEEVLTAVAQGYICARAYTSPTIRRILKSRGENVPSLTEALEYLAAENVQQVVVQPTHLLYGYEYDKLKAEAEAMADRFAVLTVGRPLLSDNEDIQCFARNLSQDHPVEDGAVTIFMGHGTEHFANAAYPALQTALHLLDRKDLFVGTVEGWPGLDDILRQLEPSRKIYLLPLMLVAGDHARNDMAGDWKSRLENAAHTVICSFTGMGQLSWVQEMYRERLVKLL